MYQCLVNNKFGQDMISHTLVVNGPPDPPIVRVTSQTTDSITFKLIPNDQQGTTPIHGYTVHYKQVTILQCCNSTTCYSIVTL